MGTGIFLGTKIIGHIFLEIKVYRLHMTTIENDTQMQSKCIKNIWKHVKNK